MHEQFFRLHAIGPDGATVSLDRVGVEYQVADG